MRQGAGAQTALASRTVTVFVLFTTAVGLYLPTLGYDFVFDDVTYITANDAVKGGLSGPSIRWALTTTQAGHRHPVTWLSHLLDVEVYGLKPAGHHLTSVLIHGINVVLVFLVLASMTGRHAASAAVAALFAVHPLHVESVAWIADRKDLLAGLFSLLALLAYVSFVRRGRIASYVLTLFLFALALFSKSMAVTFPAILLIVDAWPLDRWRMVRRSRLILEKLPFLILAVFAASLNVRAADAKSEGLTPSPWPLGIQAANALIQYATYLGKSLWPRHLAVLYPYETHPSVPGAAVLGLLLAAITVAAIRARRDAPWLLAGWAWFLVSLVPVIGLVPGGPMAMGDRYMYLAVPGFLIGAVWTVAWLCRGRRWLAAALFTVVFIALATASAIQARTWRTPRTLYERAFQVNPRNPLIYHNLAVLAARDGRTDDAIALYRQALAIDPNFIGGHHNLGVYLASRGDYEEAVEEYKAVLRLRPASFQTRYDLAGALARLGRDEEAITEYTETLRLDPSFGPAHNNLGAVLIRAGRVDEAIAHYREALRLQPASAIAWENLQAALARRDSSADRSAVP